MSRVVALDIHNGSKMDGGQTHDYLVSIASFFQGDFSIDWLVELTGLKVTQIIAILELEVGKTNFINHGAGIYVLANKSLRKKHLKKFDARKRERLHRKIADLLASEFPEDANKPQIIAKHLLHIKNNFEQCRYLVRAGDHYLKTYKTTKAFQYYNKALHDLSSLAGKEACILYADTAIKFSKVATVKHDTKKNLAILHEGLVKAKKWDHRNACCLLQMHIAKNEWLQSDSSKAVKHYEKGWKLANELNDPGLLRSATVFRSFFLFWQGQFKESIKSFERVVPDIETLPKGQFPLLAGITVGYCYYNTGQVTQGLGMFDVIRNHCLEKGDLDLASYAAGNMGTIMLDLRMVNDAIFHLKIAEKEATEAHNEWVYLVTLIMFSFAYYLKDQKELCIKYLKEYLKLSKKSHMTQNPYPYLMAVLWAMEKGELPRVKGISLENEIKDKIKDKNVFIRGIAYRYQALFLQKKGKPVSKIINSLACSIKYLKQSGHQFELCRSRLELARIHIMLDNINKAKKLTLKVSKIVSQFNEEFIPDDLRALIDEQRSEINDYLEKILDIGKNIIPISNDMTLVKQLITTVNRMTGAERGALFLIEKDKNRSRLRLRASNNITSVQIEHPDFSSSMELIEKVVKTGKGKILEAPAENDDAYFSNSAIRSRICVPLILREKVVGVLYNDNRILRAAFHKSDMDILSYFAGLAAFALDNTQAYAEIKRLNVELKKEKEYYKEEHDKSINSDDIIGKSWSVKQILSQIEQVAPTESTVLILGETGVGKELVASAIHRQSKRKNKPFLKVNCSALSEDLIVSELFGHEKGSFSGATKQRIGRFELADGGTLFLDEIGEISHDLQIRLLRVLQTREFERVGGNTTLYSDFRLIVATNKNLEKEVTAGNFRADLYYRLNVFPLLVAPLRARQEDIPLLSYHFLNLSSSKMGKQFMGISEQEMIRLLNYDWPGNVRELENIIERGTILSREPAFRIPDLTCDQTDIIHTSRGTSLKENERNHIIWALEKCSGKIRGKGGAAELLEIHPSTLHFKIKKLNILRKGKIK